MCLCSVFLDGNQDGKFSVGFRDGVVRTVVALDRETQAAYTLIVEAIGVSWIHLYLYKDRFFYHPRYTVWLYICFFFWSSKLLLCTFVWQWWKKKKNDACASAVISDYCSTAFVPVWKENKNSWGFPVLETFEAGWLTYMKGGARDVRGETRQR